LFDHGQDGGGVGDVGLHSGGRAAAGGDVLHDRCGLGLAAQVIDRDRRARSVLSYRHNAAPPARQ